MSIKKIPCGGFYVNDDAVEMIEGKPVLKTGGADPIVENAKETGGFGWTENEKTTVFSGTATKDAFGQITMDAPQDLFMNLWREVDINGKNLGVVINGVDYNCYIEDDSERYIVGPIGGDDFEITQFYGYRSIDVYLSTPTETVALEIYTYEETVHTIDPKYLGGGGGGDIYFDIMDAGEGIYDLLEDKTVQDIYDAFMASFNNGNKVWLRDGYSGVLAQVSFGPFGPGYGFAVCGIGTFYVQNNRQDTYVILEG